MLIFFCITSFVIYFSVRESLIKKHETTKDIPSLASQSMNILVYDASPKDTTYTGTLTVKDSAETLPLQFRTIKSDDFGYGGDERAKFKSTIVRFATKTNVTLSITIPGNPTQAELRSPTSQIPVNINNGTVTFDLNSHPGNYYLKTNASSNGYIDAVQIWVDDLNTLITSKPENAIEILSGQPIQPVIDSATDGSTIFLSNGVHATNNLSLKNKNNIKIVLSPNAVLKQNEGNTNEDNPFIDLSQATNITISGPGEIQSAKNNQKTVITLKESQQMIFADFLLYKVHHRDGWTLHIYQSENVQVNQLRIISGNDGTDPDSSKNVKYNNTYIEAQDDAVAVKTRGGVADGIEFKNGIVRSAASALKIGEASVDSLTTNITFLDSTVFDSDRALVVMPRGHGPIGNILYKNIVVRGMRKDSQGITIRILKSPTEDSSGSFDGAYIIFDNLDADFIEPAVVQEAITIKHSTIHAKNSINLFNGYCPTLINLTVDGPGQHSCQIQTEATYTPTPNNTQPVSTNTPTPNVTVSPTVSPSVEFTPTSTNALTATPTEVPTQTLTQTPVPPTETPVPTNTPVPTETESPTPTSTPIPPTAAPVPTNTPIPPTPTTVVIAQAPTATPTPVKQLAIDNQKPGITPWALILVPIGLLLLGILL